MELLTNEFILYFPLIQVLVQSCKLSIESSKGIYTIFICSFPCLTINIISNDLLSLYEINRWIKYINLGDLIAILGSVDFVLGSVDLLIVVLNH
jgi:NADH:ubiquinone oxidoreductase subunit D